MTTEWSHVRAGDTILGRDGNHYVVCLIKPYEHLYQTYQVMLHHPVRGVYTGSASGSVYIVDRPPETAVTELHAAKLIPDDEYRGILDRLRRQIQYGRWSGEDPPREQIGY